MKRRDFLEAIFGARCAVFGTRLPAASPVGAPRTAPCLLGAPAGSHLEPLGVQLYTVRAAMRRDPEATLERIARIGFREIEWWGEFGRTPAQLRASLDQHRLTAPSAHFGLGALEGDALGATLERALTMGHRYLVVASVNDDLVRTLDGWRRVADRFNAAAEPVRRAGLQFAYHNHDAEFRELDGRVPFELLCESTDPRLVQIEVDLYWMINAGADPLAFFRRWPGRVPLVHVKDRTADGRMVDVGAGAIDWRAIFAQRDAAGIRHYFVEHDEPRDPFASIRASYEYLRRLDV